MSKHKTLAPPPNIAARALREERFQAKVVKNPRTYSRKIKHKKGNSHPDAPLFVALTPDDVSVAGQASD